MQDGRPFAGSRQSQPSRMVLLQRDLSLPTDRIYGQNQEQCLNNVQNSRNQFWRCWKHNIERVIPQQSKFSSPLIRTWQTTRQKDSHQYKPYIQSVQVLINVFQRLYAATSASKEAKELTEWKIQRTWPLQVHPK